MRWWPSTLRRRSGVWTPYRLVAWAGDALDKVRRQVWNTERGGTGGRPQASAMLKGARWALWKNPDRLSQPHRQTLAIIQQINKPLYRAYLLKEHLREIVAVKGADGKLLLAAWLRWAGCSRLEPFVKLAKAIRRHLDAITTCPHRAVQRPGRGE